MAIVLETERLVLRHFEPGDLDVLAALDADPVFRHFLNGPRTREQCAQRLADMIESYSTEGMSLYATILRDTGAFIGRCGLLRQWVDEREQVEVAYGLDPAHWGHGYATEATRALKEYAFWELDMPRVVSIIDVLNFPSQRVAERNGMTVEKRVRFGDHDCLLYGVERS
jgi:ribosomal-protein-alanine N-acetyltransferase